MTTPLAIADRYLATWNEADATRRQVLVAALWSPQGRYADPLFCARTRWRPAMCRACRMRGLTPSSPLQDLPSKT